MDDKLYKNGYGEYLVPAPREPDISENSIGIQTWSKTQIYPIPNVFSDEAVNRTINILENGHCYLADTDNDNGKPITFWDKNIVFPILNSYGEEALKAIDNFGLALTKCRKVLSELKNLANEQSVNTHDRMCKLEKIEKIIKEFDIQ